MAVRKLNNIVFDQLLSSFNRVLRLEYAIRALRQTEPATYQALSNLHALIHTFWKSHKKWSDKEVRVCRVVDRTWDQLQLGQSLTRDHGNLYTARDEMVEGTQQCAEQHAESFALLSSKYLRCFRVCDLMEGNSILTLLRKTSNTLEAANDIDDALPIPIEKFFLGARDPVFLHPKALIVPYKDEATGASCQLLVIDYSMSITDFRAAMSEFVYQYATARQHVIGAGDGTASRLINDVLIDDLKAPLLQYVKKRTQFESKLRGLHCWDLFASMGGHDTRGAMTRALEKASEDCIEFLPGHTKDPEFKTLKADYRQATRAIQTIAAEVQR